MFLRAMLSLKKSKGKTALLFVIMLVVANLVISGLSIQSASAKSMKQIRESLGNDVTLSVNMSNMMQNRQKGQSINQVMSPITEEMANQLKDLTHVNSYNYSISTSVNSSDISAIETQSNTNMQPQGGMKEEFKDGATQMVLGDFSLSGNTAMSNIEQFSEGSYELSSGRLLTDADTTTNYVVISSSLAEDNELSVGSKFTITTTDEATNLELEVVGIFNINSSVSMGSMMFNQQNPMNTLYVSLNTAKVISGNDNLSSATYYLDDPKNIDTFKEEAQTNSTIDWDTYTLDANDMMYQRNVSTLENMESFARIFVIVVIIAGGSILCLILMLTIKNRTYEIGVLVSLGETKINIILQQFIEIVVVGIIAFTLSLGTGKMISNVISGMLESSNNSNDVMTQMPDRNSSNRAEAKGGMFSEAFAEPQNSELDVSLTAPDIAKLAAITTLICATATLLPALYILRLSPREILVRKEG